MKKQLFAIFIGILGILFLVIGSGSNAGTLMPEIIKLETKSYTKHSRGIVKFDHSKHVTDYKATCGDCHHDDKGKALDLKEGDHVVSCIECHKKPGKGPSGKSAAKLNKKQKLEYHAEAMHANCKDCHRKYDKENKTKAAPMTCNGCHYKK